MTALSPKLTPPPPHRSRSSSTGAGLRTGQDLAEIPRGASPDRGAVQLVLTTETHKDVFSGLRAERFEIWELQATRY